MILYDLARKAKRKYKECAKERAGKYLSPVRRLERVAPPSSGRFVAMTFDDGPTSMKTNPCCSERGLTDHILDILKEYGAKGTFDVIGTTEYNYPDKAGQVGSFTWGGIAYDHYPDFGMDELAGVKNRPELIRRILDEGHELTNHGWRHILFGKSPIVYGNRKCFDGITEVIEDLSTLHSKVESDFGFTIKMSRPPHYVDKTKDGYSAYDGYRYLNYQYMAASFDGGGWQVSGDYERDVEAMVLPLKRALEADPDSLNGQIIFQKDGCNMSKETPVADGLGRQLELLAAYGYRVVTVSELISMSPFEDLPDTDPIFPYARELINRGYCIARKNNRLYPDREVTVGELLTMCAQPEGVLESYRSLVDRGFVLNNEEKIISKAWKILPRHPYFHSVVSAVKSGIVDAENSRRYSIKAKVTGMLLGEILSSCKQSEEYSERILTVRDILPLLADAIIKEAAFK